MGRIFFFAIMTKLRERARASDRGGGMIEREGEREGRERDIQRGRGVEGERRE